MRHRPLRQACEAMKFDTGDFTERFNNIELRRGGRELTQRANNQIICGGLRMTRKIIVLVSADTAVIFMSF